MRKTGFLSIMILICLGCSVFSGTAGQGAVLTTLDWRSTSRGEEIKVNLDQPARFICYDITTPPQIIVDFLRDDVYCQLPGVIPVEQNLISQVRPVKGVGGDSTAGYPLDFLVIDLSAPAFYELVERENSFSLMVFKERPERPAAGAETPLKKKVDEKKEKREQEAARREAEKLRTRLRYLKY